ncbi:uncharacterized protein LOC127716660 isoform X2 [Mytilus californianus]|uniref:uncharacterized protein LOC127716660 isoform X2 n=1 Tax=Mytilus californianus TaxID=6549 RepID=UPI002247CADC|nr:uncharacterized protein LOC127716660 isoform X2 [Mytilus californianus]
MILISFVSFFFFASAEKCETFYWKSKCYSKPCSCCSSSSGSWYITRICNECCEKNGNKFCVPDVFYHRCEPASTTSDRPYTTQTPLNSTDQYSSNSSKRPFGVSLYVCFVIVAISGIILLITIVFVSWRWIRKLLRHVRRNVPYTSTNTQTDRNNGWIQQNPIYNIGDGDTTTPAVLPPVYSIGSYNCARNVTNGDLQNDPPPVYTNSSYNCAQIVTNDDLQNDPPPVYINSSYNCTQNMTNGDLQNDPPPVYTNGSFKQNYPPPVYTNGSFNCAQNVTNDDLQNDPPPVYTDGSYNCTQNMTNGDLQNDPLPVCTNSSYICAQNVTNDNLQNYSQPLFS